MKINTKEMGYLLEIKQEKHIGKAAKKLGKNPSSLSRCVRRVEEGLGISIFRKTTGGLLPTPEGELYLEMAEKVVRLEAELHLYREEK